VQAHLFAAAATGTALHQTAPQCSLPAYYTIHHGTRSVRLSCQTPARASTGAPPHACLRAQSLAAQARLCTISRGGSRPCTFTTFICTFTTFTTSRLCVLGKRRRTVLAYKQATQAAVTCLQKLRRAKRGALARAGGQRWRARRPSRARRSSRRRWRRWRAMRRAPRWPRAWQPRARRRSRARSGARASARWTRWACRRSWPSRGRAAAAPVCTPSSCPHQCKPHDGDRLEVAVCDLSPPHGPSLPEPLLHTAGWLQAK